MGTNYQVVASYGKCAGAPSSERTWTLYSEAWIRAFGAPEMVISDGGPEFAGRFERGIEQWGVFQHTTDAESPWQNAKAERHGGWVKQRLEAELSSASTVVTSESELALLVSELAAKKNAWFHRGGFTPAQLVFGQNPRVPHELLGDDPLGEAGLRELHLDPTEADSAAAEFARQHAVRQRARELAMREMSRDRVMRASHAPEHRDRQFAEGQWVYVWRRARSRADHLVARSRWTGPGAVVLQRGHTVYVAMRARLWKCNADQLRPATRSEQWAGDLLRQPEMRPLQQAARAGLRGHAVDVSQEGPPPQDAWEVPPPEEGGRVILPQGAPSGTPPTPPPAEAPARAAHPRQQPLPAVPEDEDLQDMSPHVPAEPHQGGEEVGSEASAERPPSVVEPAAEPAAEATVPHGDPGFPPPPGLPAPIEDVMPKRRRIVVDEAGDGTLQIPGGVPMATGTSSSSTAPQPAASPLVPAEQMPADARVARLREQLEQRIAERPAEADLWRDRSRSPPRVSGATGDDLSDFLAWHREQGYGGDPEYFFHGSEDFEFRPKQDDGYEIFAASRGGEVRWSGLSPKEKEQFRAADEKEWTKILNSGAVRVIDKHRAQAIRQRFPDRVITSRLIRRWKPVEGTNAPPVAKSRWCVHGHQDPDTLELKCFAPTPLTESIVLFLQVAANLGYEISFADVEQAFMQSNKLRRASGPLYVQPRDGISLDPSCLIEIINPVHGLDDAPAARRRTFTTYLVEQLGFVKSLLDPCWHCRCRRGRLDAMVLVVVDDLMMATMGRETADLRKALQIRFRFGKWQNQEADYAGRRVRVLPDRIELKQEKYVVEEIKPIEEFKEFRSTLYKVNWLARESRPEAAGTSSILASRMTAPVVEDVCCLNWTIGHLRSTAERPPILWHFPPGSMFITASDAGGVGGKPHPSDSPSDDAIAEAEWLQILYRDVIYHVDSWMHSTGPIHSQLRDDSTFLKGRQLQAHVVDAKSIFDTVLQEAPGSRQDRRTAVDLAIITEALAAVKGTVKRMPHAKMMTDSLTKEDVQHRNHALFDLLWTGSFSLLDETEELAARSTHKKNKFRTAAASRQRLEMESQADRK